MKAIILNNPLIQHKLSIIRNKKTGTKEFREIIGEIATFLCYEAMADAVLEEVEIETPICKTKAKKLVLVRKWGDRQLNQMSNSPLILTSRFV